MRKTIDVKAVPDANPDAAGEWLTLDVSKAEFKRLKAAEAEGTRCLFEALAWYLEPGYHVVAYRLR